MTIEQLSKNCAERLSGVDYRLFPGDLSHNADLIAECIKSAVSELLASAKRYRCDQTCDYGMVPDKSGNWIDLDDLDNKESQP